MNSQGEEILREVPELPKEEGRLVVTQQMGMSRLSNTKFTKKNGSPYPVANLADEGK